MSTTAAVFYQKDGYDTSGQRLLGRQAAGEGFLKGLVQHGTAPLYCYAANRTEFSEFCSRIQPWMQHPRKVQWLSSAGDPKILAQAGTIYKPDAVIAELAWQRRYTDQQAYSICGVTHTIASQGTMQAIGDLLIAPIQPWDALICTSVAVKTAVNRLLETWADYLAQRTGGRPTIEIKLPIIPLGIDCAAFLQGNEAKTTRSRLRQQLNIAPEDIVVLFVGRLIFYAKAHPVPMYLALEQAAQSTGAKIHLIQAGWFEDQREESSFKESAEIFCPSVNSIFLDGRNPDIRSGIWSAADIFISLADNIQETFGLTPIEAMAAGLPVIVSDWDGYQESVRHEIDGFRIPTLLPPPKSGLDLAFGYLNQSLNYSTYIGHASMMTAVEVEACAQALIRLVTDSNLRQRMGANGRQRARDVYDWQMVIAAYEHLWQELAEIRAHESIAVPIAPGIPPYPLCDDPFRLFAHYPTLTLTHNLVFRLGPMAAPEQLNQLRTVWITNFGADRRADLETILTVVANDGPLSAGEIFSRCAKNNPAEFMRTLGYLLKFDVLRLER